MKRIIIILMFLFCFASFVSAEKLTIQICEPSICIGGVKWEGVPGPNTDYKIIEDLRTCGVTKRVIEVEPGWYGLSVYDKDLNWIKDYVDILIEGDGEVKWCR